MKFNSILIVLPILTILMFDLGLSLRVSDFVNIFKKPKAMFAGLAGQLIVLPLIALATGSLILASIFAAALISIVLRLKTDEKRTIVIEVGMQNAAQAIAVATSPFVFANAVIATPAIIYALLMNVVLLTYVAFFRVAKK